MHAKLCWIILDPLFQRSSKKLSSLKSNSIHRPKFRNNPSMRSEEILSWMLFFVFWGKIIIFRLFLTNICKATPRPLIPNLEIQNRWFLSWNICMKWWTSFYVCSFKWWNFSVFSKIFTPRGNWKKTTQLSRAEKGICEDTLFYQKQKYIKFSTSHELFSPFVCLIL